MGAQAWCWRHRVAVDVAIAVFFVLLDVLATLGGASWWPTRPDTLAWVMLGVQASRAHRWWSGARLR